MPSQNLGIAVISFDVNYPNITGEIDLEIPHKIPKIGGKTFKLDSFSLSLSNPQVTISIPIEFFKGSITVELDTTNCTVQVSGEVEIDVFHYKDKWPVGPISIPYMIPLSLPEPSWSVNPTILNATTLQSSINSAPPSQTASATGPTLQNDDATKAELAAIFLFHGAETFIADLIAIAVKLVGNYSPALAAKAGKTREAALDASSSGVLIGFGFGATGGLMVGGAGGTGLFFTPSGDYGYYGSAALGSGVIGELSGGCVAFLYWGDAGKSALENFSGANFFLSLDAGEGLAGGGTLSWPMDEVGGKVIGNDPCAIGMTVGIGVGFPVNFFMGNSNTWAKLDPPKS